MHCQKPHSGAGFFGFGLVWRSSLRTFSVLSTALQKKFGGDPLKISTVSDCLKPDEKSAQTARLDTTGKGKGELTVTQETVSKVGIYILIVWLLAGRSRMTRPALFCRQYIIIK